MKTKKRTTTKTAKTKTRYAVGRNPKSEIEKFGQWVVGRTFHHESRDFNDMILGFMWQAWKAALPRIRK